jgi:hypothetical protein
MFDNLLHEVQFRQSKFLNEAKRDELAKLAKKNQKMLTFRQKLEQALIQLGHKLSKYAALSRAEL